MRFPESTDGSFGRLHFGEAPLADTRRVARLVRVADQILVRPAGTLPQKVPDPYQLDALYRLLAAPDVTHTAVLHTHCQLTHQRMAEATEPVILVLHDDTLLDFSGLRVEGLGPIGDGNGRGFVAHTSLAVTPGGATLGLAHQILYVPPPKGARRTRRGPGGRLWRDAAAAVPAAPEGKRFVHVADRAGDVRELFDWAELAGGAYVIRSRHDRAVAADRGEGPVDARLHETARGWAAAPPPRDVRLESRPGQPPRTAALSVAWRPVTLPRPRELWGRERRVALDVWVVRVWEAEPPAGVEPVEWLLVTNVAVTSTADAWERVDWYARRAVIEEFHKAWKTGMGVERLQLTTRARLEPAVGLLAVVAAFLLGLRDAGREPEAAQRPATDWVPSLWVTVLQAWRHGGPGGMVWSVAEFLLALGRLGGHQNRPSDGMPGWLTLWRGWSQLQIMIAVTANLRLLESGGS
jgi:hypothetical protein